MNRSEFIAELIGAAVLVAVGLTMATMALDYDLFGRNGLIRPGFMPFLAGGLMALFGLAVGFSALRQHLAYIRSRDADPGPESEAEVSATPSVEPPERVDGEAGGGAAADGDSDVEGGGEAEGGGGYNKRVAIVFGLTLITILAAPLLGFVLAFGLLIFVLLVVIERERLWIGVVISGLASFATWLVFVYFLRIPLPSGIF